jgi:hypothetical protein
MSSSEIALFPQEWLRDPKSPHLASAYHDVPWDDPALLHALIGRQAVQALADENSQGAGNHGLAFPKQRILQGE